MLDRYFARPETLYRIRSSWLGPPIEHYVTWLHERGYRHLAHRVPIRLQFATFAQTQGGGSYGDLPAFLDPFVEFWLHRPDQRRKTETPPPRSSYGAASPTFVGWSALRASFTPTPSSATLSTTGYCISSRLKTAWINRSPHGRARCRRSTESLRMSARRPSARAQSPCEDRPPRRPCGCGPVPETNEPVRRAPATRPTRRRA